MRGPGGPIVATQTGIGSVFWLFGGRVAILSAMRIRLQSRRATGLGAAVLGLALTVSACHTDRGGTLTPPEAPATPTAASVAPDPEVEARIRADVARFKTRILPTEAENAWAEIPWRHTFWEAVLEAERDRRPVLFWAMNGHPLGCT